MADARPVSPTRFSIPGPVGTVSFLLWPGPSDELPILFLHPVNTAAEVWAQVASETASERGAVAVDYRGHGASDPGGPYLPNDYARDAQAVLDHLQWNRVHVVGGSLGGAVAVELMSFDPSRVASIALFGATLHLGLNHTELDEMIYPLRELGVEEWFTRHGKDILGPAATPTAAPELIRLATGRDGGTARDVETVTEIIIGAFARADSRPTAAALPAAPPALIAVGTHDPTCPPSMARTLASYLGVNPVHIERIGHLPMLEDPQGTAHLIMEFHHSLQAAGPTGGLR